MRNHHTRRQEPSQAATQLPELMTIPEAATLLRLKPDQLSRLLREGKLKGGVKVGGAWRMRRRVLQAFMEGEKEAG